MTCNPNIWTVDLLKAALPNGISYAGQFAEISHEEFVEIVERNGGQYIRFSNHGAFAVIVIGGAGLPVLSTGEPMVLPVGRLISESEFLQLLRAQSRSEDDRLFTVRMLAELMRVPESRITAWAKAGLIRPVCADHGLMRFEFRQVAIAQTLTEMTASGVTINKLRRTLRDLQQKMPDLKEPLQQLTILEHNGPLLVRLESGNLAEVSGQMQMDFDDQPQPEPVQMRLAPALTTVVQWHDQAVQQERAGLLAEAEQSYRQALLQGGPNSRCAFDLASVLAKQGKAQQAIERYLQVIELDPRHPDAWNNLGILFADTGDVAAACDAFRHAMEIAPDDSKVHFNLADALDTMGYVEEARALWQKYLRYDPCGSPWAEYARERLRAPA